MSSTWLLPLTLLACGKPAPPAPAPAPAVPTEAAPAPVETAETAAPEPETPVSNVALDVTVERADGTRHSGRVVRVERTVDFFGEDGWTADELVLSLETEQALKKAPWTEVRSIDIAIADAAAGTSCFYDSDYAPPMYACIRKTEPSVTLADGSSWTTTMRHRWRLTFDDDETVELHLYKIPEREQTEKRDEEDHELYVTLQERLAETTASAVVSVRIDAAVP